MMDHVLGGPDGYLNDEDPADRHDLMSREFRSSKEPI
jgi:hypothetical protein